MKVLSTFVALSFFCQLMEPAVAATGSGKAGVASSDREAWNLYVAHTVANQPANVGGATFLESLGFKPYMNPGKELFRAATKVKSWPRLQVEKEALKIIYEGSPHATALSFSKEGKFLVDGREFHPDFNQPLLPQVEKFLKEGTKTEARTFSLPFVSSAYAVQDGVEGMKEMVIPEAAGVVALVVGAVLSSPGLAVAGVGMFASGLICGASKTKDDTVTKKYLNCVSKPLSWFGLNPRDRMYLKTIDCKASNGSGDSFGRIKIQVASESGLEQTRTFKHQGDLLAEVTLDDNQGNSAHLHTGQPPEGKRFEGGETAMGKQIQRSEKYKKEKVPQENFIKEILRRSKERKHLAADKKLDEAQALFTDFHYLVNLCKDPDRVKEVERAIANKIDQRRVYDTSSPGELMRGAEEPAKTQEAK